MTRYETRLLATVALRAMHAFARNPSVGNHLAHWLRRNAPGPDWGADLCVLTDTPLCAAEWSDIQTRLEQKIQRHKRARPDALARNCAELSSYLGLSGTETEIFALAARVARGEPFQALIDTLVDDARVPVDRTVAILTGQGTAAVRKAMHPAGKLISAGLISRDQDRHSHYGLEPSSRLINAMQPPARGLEDILNGVFAQACCSPPGLARP